MKETQNGQITELVQNVLEEHNQKAGNPENYRMLTVSGIVSKNEVYFNPENVSGVNAVNTFDHLKILYVLPLKDYNRMMGTNLKLDSGEAYLYTKDSKYPYDQITVENTGTWRIKDCLKKMVSNGNVSVYGKMVLTKNGIIILIFPVRMKSRFRSKMRLTRKLLPWRNRKRIRYFSRSQQTAEQHLELITRLYTVDCFSLEFFSELFSFLEWY